jgi:beta-xylosidase
MNTPAAGLIQNPVLRGFHSDPSICRVGDDYYIATSTFEWFPGVVLSHSRDLVNWRTVGHALTRISQLDMRGDPNSGGIWAPCLTYSDGLFWLIYTDVRGWTGSYKDVRNFLVTSPSIEGPWSEPTYLNAKGFDASLFHDEDGRKYLVQMIWDARPNKNPFAGIILQEYDVKAGKLAGPTTRIFGGTSLGLVEGPHLLRKDGWYYLTCARQPADQLHQRPRESAPERRPWLPRADRRRRLVFRASLPPTHRQGTIGTRPRDRHPEDHLGQGWLAQARSGRSPPGRGSSRPGHPAPAVAAASGAR